MPSATPFPPQTPLDDADVLPTLPTSLAAYGGFRRACDGEGKVGKKSRGKGGGRTRGPKGARDKPRKLDKASLDDDLDSYMMRDRKVGTTKLNEDLDDYFKNAKKKAEEEEVKVAPAAAEEKAK